MQTKYCHACNNNGHRNIPSLKAFPNPPVSSRSHQVVNEKKIKNRKCLMKEPNHNSGFTSKNNRSKNQRLTGTSPTHPIPHFLQDSHISSPASVLYPLVLCSAALPLQSLGVFPTQILTTSAKHTITFTLLHVVPLLLAFYNVSTQ